MTAKTIKIALCDLRHSTRGLHASQMPIGIGQIGAYAVENIEGAEVDIRLYYQVEKILADLEEWKPDVVGGAFYGWARNLTLFTLGRAKELNPDCLTVLGGPEIDMDSTDREEFVRANPHIDICVAGEGEDTFREIVQYRVDGIDPRSVDVIEGTFLRRDDDSYAEHPQRPKLPSLDVIPSPYLTGLFDEFFEQSLMPFIETSRGCPYRCSFCRQSLKMHQKVRFGTNEKVARELDYCAEKYAGKHGMRLYLADSNFGMYPQSLDAAKEMRRVQDEYDWPRYIAASMGKNAKHRIIEVSKTLKWGMHLTMSVQSFNPATLKAIDRDNISIDAMTQSVSEGTHDGEDSYSELIFNLPMETRESFEAGIRKCIDMGLNRVIIMTLSLLKGTPLATRETRELYKFKTMYRIIPRAFGKYEGKVVLEPEEVVIENSTMSFEDHMYLRKLQLILQVVFNADHFNVVRRALVENGIDPWLWIQRVLADAEKDSGSVGDMLRRYTEEAQDELYPTLEAMQKFAEENYDKLLSGERGDNLMNKYTVEFGTDMQAWGELVTNAARDILIEDGVAVAEATRICDNLERFILMKFDFSKYFDVLPVAGEKTRIQFDYNLERWADNHDLRLEDCADLVEYELSFSEKKIKAIRDTLAMGHDRSQTIQFVYRDRRYHSFLPSITEVVQAAE
tara:strand:- start:2272 stop:4305 length:2034 start_codon:yes stop_codon:yes gene_type:complete